MFDVIDEAVQQGRLALCSGHFISVKCTQAQLFATPQKQLARYT
jgi:hypothetical protein